VQRAIDSGADDQRLAVVLDDHQRPDRAAVRVLALQWPRCAVQAPAAQRPAAGADDQRLPIVLDDRQRLDRSTEVSVLAR
jgi:hypothetical protein